MEKRKNHPNFNSFSSASQIRSQTSQTQPAHLRLV